MKYHIEGVQLTPTEVAITTVQQYTDDGFVPRDEALLTGGLIGQRIRVMEGDLAELEAIDAVQGTCLDKMRNRLNDVAAIQEKLIDIGCADVDLASDARDFLNQDPGDK